MDRRQQDTLEQEQYEYEAGLLRADPAFHVWLDVLNKLEHGKEPEHEPG